MSLPNPYDKPTLTVPEAADMLRVSKSAAYAAINDGRWPTTVINVGGRIRIPTAELLKVMVIDGQGPDPAADWPDIEEP